MPKTWQSQTHQMPQSYLTKSTFTQSITCHTKLHYIQNKYPSTTSDNEYLKFLAQGGFMIGALAQLMYPSGIKAPQTDNKETNAQATKQKIQEGDTVLFEATLLEGKKLAVTDILERKGNTLRVIEVKSKSIDTAKVPLSETFRGKKGNILSEWHSYLFDITFQYALAAKTFPELQVSPFLLLVDKSKRCLVDSLPSYFTLHQEDKNSSPTVSIKPESIEALKSLNILTLVDVSSEVKELLPFITSEMQTLEASLMTGLKAPPKLATRCKDCQFQGDTLSPNGYNECWKEIPKPTHHIFDLYFGSMLKNDGNLVFDDLIAKKKISLFDIPIESLKGKRGERQRLQIECTQKNQEWIDPELKRFTKEVTYPLHFIDFETTRTALPFHKGMRPFEQIAFQWSCHTVNSPGAEPIHSEWINTEAEFPNFAFAKSLMETLSPNGTVLVWASHEGSVLSDILEQMETYQHEDPQLKEFLQRLTSEKGSQKQLVDMNRLTVEHYFHPEIAGKTSIKKVLPAVLKANSPDGKFEDPYKNLPPLVIAGSDVSVQEGTAAMRAYEEMIFGNASKDLVEKEKWKKLLLQYCELDTLAMVLIWGRWGATADRRKLDEHALKVLTRKDAGFMNSD